MTKPLKPDTQNTLPHGNASQVGEYPGMSGRMLSEWVGGSSGIRNAAVRASEASFHVAVLAGLRGSIFVIPAVDPFEVGRLLDRMLELGQRLWIANPIFGIEELRRVDRCPVEDLLIRFAMAMKRGIAAGIDIGCGRDRKSDAEQEKKWSADHGALPSDFLNIIRMHAKVDSRKILL
jgi:hypothetical protein